MTMSAKETIARRVAKEVRPGSLVNLGIGLPTLVDAYMPPGVTAFFLTENGLIGIGAPPPPGMENPDLIDAGNEYVTAVPGASSLDSTVTFGLIRGGHLDLAVLGGLQVDKHGRLANWMIPGKLVPGMGGAMDLVSGARRIIIGMIHTAKGVPKIVEECTLPLTSVRPVSLVVTEMAVLEPTPEGLLLREAGTRGLGRRRRRRDRRQTDHPADRPGVRPVMNEAVKAGHDGAGRRSSYE